MSRGFVLLVPGETDDFEFSGENRNGNGHYLPS
jgi:hypothetical protein